MNETWDVIVAGAGPAGATAAALLAEAGRSVLVLEKDAFPRFHIGESLLPAAEILETRLGIKPDPSLFLHKRGAQFVCERTGREKSFDFADALPGPRRSAWHVDRSKFDALVRDRARELGAEIRHGIAVKDCHVGTSGVSVTTTTGTEACRFFIDASGQGRFFAKKNRTICPYEHFGRAAAFAHFQGLSDAALELLGEGNDIRIMMVEEGWGWIIPLAGRRLSVGIVSRTPGIKKTLLQKFLDESSLLQQLTDGADQGETQLTGNFSFFNSESSGPRFACVGDAACFIDPVFSSGVSLAMRSAIHTVEALLPALDEGREADANLMAPVKQTMSRAYDTFSALVYRFYNTRFVDNLIFGAPTGGSHYAEVTSVLAGDVFREDNAFQNMLLSSGRHRSRRQPNSAADALAETA